MAENFAALTGAWWRGRAFTRTSRVCLLLAHELCGKRRSGTMAAGRAGAIVFFGCSCECGR
ncbi:hypothetical protein EB820_00630 [Brevibacillus agri]|uniref:Uncharacterized protein n=1 Tax=Brevibacillus agri TaxID=51101 RepID=A0A3M8BDS4_9BACL|nr:hypothetical protein BA6348_03475 [Brevibacillus agri]RNB61546.1 hypothetical protein EB820_00630 [Brevibacillus agri]